MLGFDAPAYGRQVAWARNTSHLSATGRLATKSFLRCALEIQHQIADERTVFRRVIEGASVLNGQFFLVQDLS